MLGSTTQSSNPATNIPNPATLLSNPNLTFASILTNESGQTASNPSGVPNRQFLFQVIASF